jgi:hypothetical protein
MRPPIALERREVTYCFGCQACGMCGALASDSARADQIAVHGRRCSSAVSVWVQTRAQSITIDLDNTTDCPRSACEVCGWSWDVSTHTVGTRVGVACIRICDRCADPGGPPPFDSRDDAKARVLLHCEHLGITLDEMAAALAAETWRGDAR